MMKAPIARVMTACFFAFLASISWLSLRQNAWQTISPPSVTPKERKTGTDLIASRRAMSADPETWIPPPFFVQVLPVITPLTRSRRALPSDR